MDVLKTELVSKGAEIYARLYARAIIIKIILFVIGFSTVFWYIRLHNIIPTYKLEEDLRSIPVLFGAGNFIYSIFTGFIVQTQWTKWDRLIEANRGEITMLRQLFIFAHHFPRNEMLELRYHIYNYFKIYIEASDTKDHKVLATRSRTVDDALIKIDDSMFKILKKYPDRSSLATGYLTRAMEYRERKIQLSNQRLPLGIKLFVYFATFSVIFGSLFLPFNNIIFNYYFTIVVALLAFGVYLIIEDFDYPYRPGNYVLSVGSYIHVRNEIKAKLEQRGFDVEKADAEQKETEI
jgi:cytochrome c biogenesis protein CcdA